MDTSARRARHSPRSMPLSPKGGAIAERLDRQGWPVCASAEHERRRDCRDFGRGARMAETFSVILAQGGSRACWPSFTFALFAPFSLSLSLPSVGCGARRKSGRPCSHPCRYAQRPAFRESRRGACTVQASHPSTLPCAQRLNASLSALMFHRSPINAHGNLIHSRGLRARERTGPTLAVLSRSGNCASASRRRDAGRRSSLRRSANRRAAI